MTVFRFSFLRLYFTHIRLMPRAAWNITRGEWLVLRVFAVLTSPFLPWLARLPGDSDEVIFDWIARKALSSPS